MMFTATQLLAVLAAVTQAHVAQSPLGSDLSSSSKLTINSTLKMNSGHSIPILGFGVWQTYVIDFPSLLLRLDLQLI